MSEEVPESIRVADLPALKAPLADGIYGGCTTLPDGRNVAVVFLHNAKPTKRQGVDAMRAWAKSIGAQLITRAIGALLVSTIGDLLPQEVVWTEEDYALEPSAYAWRCALDRGYIFIDFRTALRGAVAVRLIPLIS